MLRKISFFTLVNLGLLVGGYGQNKDVREQAYLHLNTPFLLTGETLNFSAFVTSVATGKPSVLSSILYLEMVDANGKPIFQQKISLKNGRGYGEFFASSLVPTGRYQLLAYTRWMKNFQDYFQTEVTVVNPFEEYAPPPPITGTKPLVAFYPEGGSLVAGKSNVVIFRVINADEKPVSATGKVVSSAGEKVADLKPDEMGSGRFVFTPEAGEVYQAIVEDTLGEFHFYTLPKAGTDAMTIQVKREKDVFKLTVVSSESEQVLLKVSDRQNEVLNASIYTNSPVILGKTDLTPGVYRASALNRSGEEESFRLFLHEKTLKKTERLSVEEFGTRSLVQIPLEFDRAVDVSVSVRRRSFTGDSPGVVENSLFSNILSPAFYPLNRVEQGKYTREQLDNLMVMSSWKWEPHEEKKTVDLLPELRGEILSGRVSSVSGANVQNKIVAYSISGEDYQMQTAETDDAGNFVIRIDPFQGGREAYLSVIDDEESYSFSLDHSFLREYPDFNYSPLYLDSASVAEIVRRSVRNQIENAYYEFREASVISRPYWPLQFDFDHFYVLDDYNRFPEMHDHFTEFIPLVLARKNKNGSRIKVFLDYTVPDQKDPLLLLDGVPVTADQILNFSPYKVASIGVISKRFFLGPMVANGVISFHTFDNDLQGFSVSENTLKIPYQGLEPLYAYAFPEYEVSGEMKERRPDYRDQLYWAPMVSVEPGKPYLLEFYTSDTTGEFEVVAEGYNEAGEPINVRKFFRVREASHPASN